MNHCTLSVFHRSHFGSRYQSGRCALRSPFSKPCKFESPSCHFSFPSEKAVKAVCFCGLAKSRRVSTNVKKTPAAATQRKLKMIPVRIRFESDSNPIRIRFESDSSPAVVQRGICIKTQKKKKENESASTRSIHKNAKTKKHNASTRSMTRGSFKNCL